MKPIDDWEFPKTNSTQPNQPKSKARAAIIPCTIPLSFVNRQPISISTGDLTSWVWIRSSRSTLLSKLLQVERRPAVGSRGRVIDVSREEGT